MFNTLDFKKVLEVRQYKKNSDQLDRLPRLNFAAFLMTVHPTFGQNIFGINNSTGKEKQTSKKFSSSD